jgi:hypothetical protein
MTLTPFTVYLIMQADAVCCVLGITAAIAGMALAFITFSIFDDSSAESAFETFKEMKMKRWWLLWLLALLPVAIAIPNTKTLAAMYVVPAIANSEPIQKDFPQLYDLAINKLKEQLKPATEAAK